jgi:hypothetical protein
MAADNRRHCGQSESEQSEDTESKSPDRKRGQLFVSGRQSSRRDRSSRVNHGAMMTARADQFAGENCQNNQAEVACGFVVSSDKESQ